jgi:hypothetical protein
MKLDYYMDQALKEKKEEEEEENDVKEQSDNTPISNFPFDVVKDKNIKGKSTVALSYVFKNEEKEISRTNSKFCEEFKGDLKRLRRKFSQDDLY